MPVASRASSQCPTDSIRGGRGQDGWKRRYRGHQHRGTPMKYAGFSFSYSFVEQRARGVACLMPPERSASALRRVPPRHLSSPLSPPDSSPSRRRRRTPPLPSHPPTRHFPMPLRRPSMPPRPHDQGWEDLVPRRDLRRWTSPQSPSLTSPPSRYLFVAHELRIQTTTPFARH